MRFFLLIGWLLLSGILFSCNEEGTLGAGLIPNVNGVGLNQVDTFSIEATTVREDTLRSSNSSVNLVGMIYDPIFGTTRSDFYAQSILLPENVIFGDSLQLDSVILSMSYSSYYGDTSLPVDLAVYELSDSLQRDSIYFNNKSFAVKPNPLAKLTVTARPSTSLKSNEVVGGLDSVLSIPACLRIRLSDDFGRRLLSKSGQPELANNTNFLQFFRGFKVACENNSVMAGGSMLGFNLRNAYSTLSLYYHAGSKRKPRFDFVLAPNGAVVNSYQTKNDGMANNELGKTNAASGQMYVSGLSGYKTKIMFPYLAKLAEQKNILINKAELVFKPVNYVLPSKFEKPGALIVVGIDSSGKSVLIPDQGESYYNGVYDASQSLYRFVISREIQNLVNSTSKYGLYLVPELSSVKPSRVILGNPSHPLLKPKLVITYTYLNKK